MRASQDALFFGRALRAARFLVSQVGGGYRLLRCFLRWTTNGVWDEWRLGGAGEGCQEIGNIDFSWQVCRAMRGSAN